jgi:hypothetical protein
LLSGRLSRVPLPPCYGYSLCSLGDGDPWVAGWLDGRGEPCGGRWAFERRAREHSSSGVKRRQGTAAGGAGGGFRWIPGGDSSHPARRSGRWGPPHHNYSCAFWLVDSHWAWTDDDRLMQARILKKHFWPPNLWLSNFKTRYFNYHSTLKTVHNWP